MKMYRLNILIALLLLMACRKGPESAPAGAALPRARVRVAEALEHELRPSREVAGTVIPKLRATIEAKIAGRISEMPVRLGQNVRKGELLAKLDVAEAQAKLAQAEATREQADQDLRRFSALLKEQALTQAEFDAARARARVAEAGVHQAETIFQYAAIVAPFDGVIARKFAETGDLAVPGKPLLELDQPEPLRFVANVPESLMSEVHANGKLAIQIEGQPQPVTGCVIDISPSGDPATRSSRVELDLASAGARSGSFGRLFIPGDLRATVLVPQSAVVHRGQLEIVFVSTNEQAQLRLVKTGAAMDDKIEILAGLAPGEKVVVEDARLLRDGQRVVVP